MSLTINGIILRVIPYKEKGIIIHLLTEEEGLISAILYTTKKDPKSWIEPFLLVKGKIKEKRGDFYTFVELEGEHWFWGLRERPEALKTLRSLTHRLRKVIVEESKVPLLFQLFLKVVQALEKGQDPDAIEALFLVKLGYHEGILPDEIGDGDCSLWVDQAKRLKSLKSIPELPSNSVLESLKELFR